MSELIVYGYPASTFVRTVRMACVEKGVPYTLDPFESFEFQSDTHRQLHPFAKMPVMRHDDVVLYETLAICHYIDEIFEGPALVPQKLLDRCRMLQWISAINDSIYHRLVRQWILPVSRNPELDDESRLQRRNNARDVLAVLDDRCADGDFLVGNAASLADLFLVPILAYAVRLDEQILGGLSALDNVWAELSSRSSFAETMK